MFENLTIYNNSMTQSQDICAINQYNMLSYTCEKLPQKLYYMILVAFIMLILYHLIKSNQVQMFVQLKEVLAESFFFIALILNAILVFTMWYFVFDLTPDMIKGIELYIRNSLIVGIIILVSVLIYKHRETIKEWIKQIGE